MGSSGTQFAALDLSNQGTELASSEAEGRAGPVLGVTDGDGRSRITHLDARTALRAPTSCRSASNTPLNASDSPTRHLLDPLRRGRVGDPLAVRSR